ncbi:uncharacterized protein LOC129218333 isoform X3 [Uloborus diversus]|uniref:uncharacterized protein LOC129218333 isoform X3 n=1 Tax=Uloborus diversus TaxID=327109 RepID=UPI002409B64C|nr:uncharacterized protein LOC129218333 isoform X3 [Uloborus diversus]
MTRELWSYFKHLQAIFLPMNDRRVQWAWYAASTICLLGGVLLGTVGVTMIIFGLQTTEKLEDKVWEVSLLIIGAAFLVILIGAVGCSYSRSRQVISNREQSIIKCIAFHSGMAEMPDGTNVPPCCSNSDAVKIWTTINPHSRMAWNSDIPGQLEDEMNEEKPTSA